MDNLEAGWHNTAAQLFDELERQHPYSAYDESAVDVGIFPIDEQEPTTKQLLGWTALSNCTQDTAMSDTLTI